MLHILGNATLINLEFLFKTPHNQMFDLSPCATLTINPPLPVIFIEKYITNGLQAQHTVYIILKHI